MAGNSTEIGITNFDICESPYLAKTRIKTPPSNMSAYNYAPGSPKPMKEIGQDYNEMNTADMINLSHHLTDRNISPASLETYEIKNEQNGTLGNKMDGGLKDAHIKHLDRTVKILQARLRQLDGTEQKFEDMRKERDLSLDELHRTREQLKKSNQDKEDMNHRILQLQHIIRQNNGKVDLISNDDSGEKGRLFEENNRLRMESNSLKKLIDSLTSERSSLRESLSAYENSQSSSSGSSSVVSSQGCTKELENLHQVVDALKSTVLKQRNFLLKFKTSQSTPTQRLEPKGLAKTVANHGPIIFPHPHDLPHFRQGEEGSAPPLLGLKERTEPSNFGANNLSVRKYSKPIPAVGSNALNMGMTADMMLPSAVSEMSSKSQQDMAMNVPGFDTSTPHIFPMGRMHINAYSNNVDGMDKLNSPLYGANDLYYNNPGDMYLDPRSNSPKGPHHEGMTTASPKRGSPKAEERPKRDIQPRDPARKISQSEILYRRPTPHNQPTRSKTETLGHNPRVKPKLQSEAEPVWLQPPAPSVPIHQHGVHQIVHQGRGHAPLLRPEVRMQPSVGLGQMQTHPPVDCSQYRGTHDWDLYSSNSPAADNNMAAKVATRSDAACTSDSSLAHAVESSPGYSQSAGHSSDQLCPVCHQDFGSVTIEQFQSHILDCFDNENGPETLLTDNLGPQRICPMCNTSFGEGMSQTEYEKHVHSHFGENPGENFELLQP